MRFQMQIFHKILRLTIRSDIGFNKFQETIHHIALCTIYRFELRNSFQNFCEILQKTRNIFFRLKTTTVFLIQQPTTQPKRACFPSEIQMLITQILSHTSCRFEHRKHAIASCALYFEMNTLLWHFIIYTIALHGPFVITGFICFCNKPKIEFSKIQNKCTSFIHFVSLFSSRL